MSKADVDGNLKANLRPATRLTLGGRDPFAHHGYVNTPVYHASTLLYRSADDFENRRGPYSYGRRGTPTSEALETLVGDDFDFDVEDDVATPEKEEVGADVEDAPVVRFLQKMLVDAHDRALASAVIHLCKELDMRVVAEGVETPEERETLRRIGVRYGQGFGLHRPMAAADLAELLSRG